MKKSLLKRFLLIIWFAPIVTFPLAQIRLSLIMAWQIENTNSEANNSTLLKRISR